MNKIPVELLLEVFLEIDEELGYPDEYAVPITELFERLVAKGWQPYGRPYALPPHSH